MQYFTYHLIRVPYEQLNGSFRIIQKKLTKEIQAVINELDLLSKSLSTGPENIDIEINNYVQYQSLTEKLENLYEEYKNYIKIQDFLYKQIKTRLQLNDYLLLNPLNGNILGSDTYNNQWNILLHQYLLSNGLLSTAKSMEFVSKDVLNRFSDSNLHEERVKILNSLQKDNNIDLLFEWYRENEGKINNLDKQMADSSLTKLKDEIYRQKLISLVNYIHNLRQKLLSEASTESIEGNTETTRKIENATKDLEEIKKLSLPSYPGICYKTQNQIFCDFAIIFDKTFRKLNGISSIMPFEIFLQVGLSVLKTPICNTKSKFIIKTSIENPALKCPTCSEIGKSLSKALPYCRQEKSKLRCRYTYDIVDDKNYPLALSNGQVYSANALDKLLYKAKRKLPREFLNIYKNNRLLIDHPSVIPDIINTESEKWLLKQKRRKPEKKVLMNCPVTDISFSLEDLQKVYII